MRKLLLIFLASGLALPVPAWSQSPTPAQGTDGVAFRVVRTDSLGRLVIAPGGGASTCPSAATPCVVAGIDPSNVIRPIRTTSFGDVSPANTISAAGDGKSNTEQLPSDSAGTPLFYWAMPHWFDGSTWSRARGDTTGMALKNSFIAGADAASNNQFSLTDISNNAIVPRSFGSYFNGTTWDRVRGNTSGAAPSNASSADADGLSNTGLGLTDVAGTSIVNRSWAHVFNGTTWDRARGNTSGAAPANASSADGDAVSNTGLGLTDAAGTSVINRAWAHVFNGTTWDRARGNTSGAFVQGPAADGSATAGNPVLDGGTDGTNARSFRVASLANFNPATTLTNINSIGAQIEEKGSRWSAASVPAVSTQASASIAAEANVRHVADCISFSSSAVLAPLATSFTINLRNGATGAGTVIWSLSLVSIPAVGQLIGPANFCGLNLVGSTNTAMTLEFGAAVTNVFQAVTLTGFNVN